MTEQKLIQMMREEWARRVALLEKGLNVFMKIPGETGKKPIIGDETKLWHKGSRLMYTVQDVNLDPVELVLKTPEGKPFTVDGDEVEAEYGLRDDVDD